MSFVPGEKGVGLARLECIQAFIIANLADLNTCISSNSVTSILQTNFAPLPINNTTVVIGDVDSSWNISEGYLKIAVCPGNMRNGLDGTFERKYINNGGGITETRNTDIYIIYHPSVFNTDKVNDQRLLRLNAIEASADWLVYGCLNRPGQAKVGGAYLPITTRGAGQMPLVSRVYQINTVDPAQQQYDELQLCMVTNVLKGYFVKGPANGGRAYWGIHAVHESVIQ